MTDPDDTLAKILEEINKNRNSGNCCCCRHCNNCWWKYQNTPYPYWPPTPFPYPYGPVCYTQNTINPY